MVLILIRGMQFLGLRSFHAFFIGFRFIFDFIFVNSKCFRMKAHATIYYSLTLLNYWLLVWVCVLLGLWPLLPFSGFGFGFRNSYVAGFCFCSWFMFGMSHVLCVYCFIVWNLCVYIHRISDWVFSIALICMFIATIFKERNTSELDFVCKQIKSMYFHFWEVFDLVFPMFWCNS